MATVSVGMTVATSGAFMNRVKGAMQKTAIAVMSEAGSVANHAARVVFAPKILDGTASTREYAIGIMMQTAVLAACDPALADDGISDAVLETNASAVFNAFAGVFNPVV